LVDFDAEIAKCDKKLDLATLNLEKVKKVESQADYEGTVPVNVRSANEAKVCVLFLVKIEVLTVSSIYVEGNAGS
jgi:hypothetical protein